MLRVKKMGNSAYRLVGVLAIAGACMLAAGHTQALTISNHSPAWVLLPGSVGPTGGIWGLPANLNAIGCGSENETSCEPAGIFGLDQAIASTAGYLRVLDASGDLSDYVLFSNIGPGGTGVVQFFSDPDLNADLDGLSEIGVCTENGGTCDPFALTLADASVLTITVASDEEAYFDPFGYGFDTSDAIGFQCDGPCTLVNQVPEPTMLPLFLTILGLGGLGYFLTRKERIGKLIAG